MTLKYHEVVRTQFTDSNGLYTFTDVPICFCLKNISASKRGYESQYQLVAVEEITYANFSLKPASSNDPKGEPDIAPNGINEKGISVEQKDHHIALTGVIGIFLVFAICIYLYSIKRRLPAHK
jgi:hypothetical protein